MSFYKLLEEANKYAPNFFESTEKIIDLSIIIFR